MERKGEVIPCSWTEDSKGVRTNSGESGVGNLEAVSIRCRAESTGRYVQLKTVTEIRWSSVHNTFRAESVYFLLNSLLVWEPVVRLKQRSEVVSFTF